MFYTHDLVFEKNSRFRVIEGEEEDKGKEKNKEGKYLSFPFIL